MTGRPTVALDTRGAAPLLVQSHPSHHAIAALHRVLSGLGVSGGATYDGLVALTALDHDAELATRDARARSTYDAVGVRVVLLVEEA